jgi:hypothetical protein
MNFFTRHQLSQWTAQGQPGPIVQLANQENLYPAATGQMPFKATWEHSAIIKDEECTGGQLVCEVGNSTMGQTPIDISNKQSRVLTIGKWTMGYEIFRVIKIKIIQS